MTLQRTSNGKLLRTSNGALARQCCCCPDITLDDTLPDGVVGVAYNGTVTASGGTSPYTYAITAGALPAGLSLNASTGEITGTPESAETANFTVTATDLNGCEGSRAYTVVIGASCSFPPAWTPPSVLVLASGSGTQQVYSDHGCTGTLLRECWFSIPSPINLTLTNNNPDYKEWSGAGNVMFEARFYDGSEEDFEPGLQFVFINLVGSESSCIYTLNLAVPYFGPNFVKPLYIPSGSYAPLASICVSGSMVIS